MNAGNAAYNVSTAFTRLNRVTQCSIRRIKGFGLTDFGLEPPMFFMNIMTSFSSAPIVSWVLPYTCAIEIETKSPYKAEAASRTVF
jgi:hypothetical protein